MGEPMIDARNKPVSSDTIKALSRCVSESSAEKVADAVGISVPTLFKALAGAPLLGCSRRRIDQYQSRVATCRRSEPMTTDEARAYAENPILSQGPRSVVFDESEGGEHGAICVSSFRQSRAITYISRYGVAQDGKLDGQTIALIHKICQETGWGDRE